MTIAPRGRILAQAAAALMVPLLLLGLLSLAPAHAATSTTTVATMSAAQTATYEREVQYFVNQVRAQHGLRKLRVASCTDQVAERWNRHLATSGGFYHQSMQTVLQRCNARYAGETLGRGGMAPRELIQLWMDSPPHRAVLLSGKSRRIGVGAEYDAAGRWVVTANFMRF